MVPQLVAVGAKVAVAIGAEALKGKLDKNNNVGRPTNTPQSLAQAMLYFAPGMHPAPMKGLVDYLAAAIKKA